MKARFKLIKTSHPVIEHVIPDHKNKVIYSYLPLVRIGKYTLVKLDEVRSSHIESEPIPSCSPESYYLRAAKRWSSIPDSLIRTSFEQYMQKRKRDLKFSRDLSGCYSDGRLQYVWEFYYNGARANEDLVASRNKCDFTNSTDEEGKRIILKKVKDYLLENILLCDWSPADYYKWELVQYWHIRNSR